MCLFLSFLRSLQPIFARGDGYLRGTIAVAERTDKTTQGENRVGRERESSKTEIKENPQNCP